MKNLSYYTVSEFKLEETLTYKGRGYQHLGFEKPLQSYNAKDDLDQWRTVWLSKLFIEELKRKSYFNEEMQKKEKKLSLIYKARYPALFLGTLFGALVIIPTYVGKTTRSLRKLIPILTGLAFYSASNWAYYKYSYLVQMQLYDGMPAEYRRWVETKDHRYLATLNLSDLKVNAYNESNKKFLY